MDIFVIHSGPDRNEIVSHLEELKKKASSSNVLNAVLMERKLICWKQKARKLIKNAQLVLYVAGDDSSEKSIRWELKTAVRNRKRICVIKKDQNVNLSDGLKIKEPFSREEKEYGYQEIEYSQLLDIAMAYNNATYGLFNGDTERSVSDSDSIYLEQYKLFVQTSEELVKRRQNVNSFYMSIHSALVAFMSALFALEIDPRYLQYFGILLCIAGITMSYSWRNMLISYGQLNSAKMKIIAMMESHLPLSLYDAEWRVLDDPMSKKRYKSFTQKERAIPWCFLILYVILAVSLVHALISGETVTTETVAKVWSAYLW